MKRLAAAGLLVVIASAPAHAQRMGSSNRNAPTIKQSITFGKETIEVNYTSITWAGGQWAAALADEAKRGPMRDGINATADKTPLGTFVTSAAITIGSTKVAAGTYKLAYTLDDKFNWQLQLTSDAGKLVCALDLKTVEDDHKRLVTSLRAGEKDNTAELLIAFGKQRCVLQVAFEK